MEEGPNFVIYSLLYRNQCKVLRHSVMLSLAFSPSISLAAVVLDFLHNFDNQ